MCSPSPYEFCALFAQARERDMVAIQGEASGDAKVATEPIEEFAGDFEGDVAMLTGGVTVFTARQVVDRR